jgi:molybdate transport system ATP-binding protein
MSVEARLRLRRGDFSLDVDLTVPARGVTALYGRSGAGKTTLLRALAGLEPCPDGYLSVAGEIWQDATRRLPVHRRPLGFVFQEPSLFPHLSVRDNVAFALRRLRNEERRIGLGEAVEWLGLAPLLERRIEGLSGGERQRVAIARALLASPRLLLMDEPLASLDARSKAGILPYLDRLQRELAIPIIYVSHALDEVARIADHLVWLERGKVHATGPIAEILTRLDLPLARRGEAEALVEATVAGHDAADRLSYLDFAGGRFIVPAVELRPGARVRLRVRAADVSLTLERQSGTSILNVFPVFVTGVAEDDGAQVTVRLEAGGTPLLARVTRRSARVLGLAAGAEVWAQVKSVAILGGREEEA